MTNHQALQEGRRNRDEALARLEKAWDIAAVLERFQTDAETAANLDQAGRDAAAALAGRKPPSEKTWAIVVRHLRSAEADPFEGLPQ